MDEMGEDDKPSGSILMRHRSRAFSNEEVKALLNIIDKYKTIVFNKSTTTAANHAKEVTWAKIAKMFNGHSFKEHRNADSLKMKVDNMKRAAKKVSKNIMDASDEPDDLLGQLLAMICEAENNTCIVDHPVQSDEEFNGTDQNDKDNTSQWHENCSENRDSDDSGDGDGDNKRLVNRSINFSPQECNLLLQCVRQEKIDILSKSTSGSANKLKNRAWVRVTNSYNKLSPQKRSTKVLRTKFCNMKRMTRNMNFKGYFKKKKQEDSDKKIKTEPFEFGEDIGDDDDNVHHDIETFEKSDHLTPSMDPLNTVLSIDSGICTTSVSENKEVVKLKLELLNYELETAKIQRKRIEDLAQAEAAEREAKAIESSLRLRAARLEVIAAEMKLPPSHYGLNYLPEEDKAQQYIQQYHAT